MTWRVAKPDSWDGRAGVILAHGAGQGIDSPFMKFFHQELARRGFLSVTFNFEYMDQRRKIPDPQPKMQALYRRVAEEVAQQYKPGVLIIGGKSMGGRVASYVAGDAPLVNGLVFLGYPLHPPGKPDQLRDAHLYNIKKPMLFLSGTRDAFAGRELLDGVVDRIGEQATVIWTEGGDHSLKAGKSSDSLNTAAENIQRWIQLRL